MGVGREVISHFVRQHVLVVNLLVQLLTICTVYYCILFACFALPVLFHGGWDAIIVHINITSTFYYQYCMNNVNIITICNICALCKDCVYIIFGLASASFA